MPVVYFLLLLGEFAGRVEFLLHVFEDLVEFVCLLVAEGVL